MKVEIKSDLERAGWYADDCRKWLSVMKRHLTAKANGKRVSGLAIRNAAGNAESCARSAAHFARKAWAAMEEGK